jgi:serine phosphatase RsbU (regulator of sigma subunit)
VKYLFLILFFNANTLSLFAADTLFINEEFEDHPLTEYAEILQFSGKAPDMSEVLKPEYSKKFVPLKSITPDYDQPVHWLRFTIRNNLKGNYSHYLNIAFSDSIELYVPKVYGNYDLLQSGDLFRLQDRPVDLGVIVTFPLVLVSNKASTFYIKLTSSSGISQQAKKRTLNSLKLFSEAGYDERYEQPRIYQALFYGAFFIMLFYNFFLYLTLRDKSYGYYLVYLFLTALFLASNSGYLLELIYPSLPRFDLYLRFATVPLLLISYVLFASAYLQIENILPRYVKVVKGTVIALVLGLLIMISGFWMVGRTINISLAMVVFLGVLFLSVKVYLKGYSPARYFLIANALLLLGGIVFALEKFSLQLHNPLTQYSLQIAIVLEVALFSIGLADRIKLTRKKLMEATLARERVERERTEELRKLSEAKNRELEEKVAQRTKEVVTQNEELAKQNEKINSSIRYAQRIQEAMLGASSNLLDPIKQMPGWEGFVLFQPREMVSGDFYWYAEKDYGMNHPVRILVIADCTGHGVPGAFMTVLGSSLLNEIINIEGTVEPSLILQELDQKLTYHLQRKDKQSNDGMDMTILVIDENQKTIKFAGAKNPLYLVKDNQMQRIKGDKFAIGGQLGSEEKEFTTHTFNITPGDRYYLFSDGYQDQFGGDKGRKFMSKRFRELLYELNKLPFEEQKTRLKKGLDDWMKGYPQTDDIIVVGIGLD